MSLASSLIHFINSRSAGRFEQATMDALQTQTRKLLEIVRQNEGQVTVDSAPGAGTTFSIYLPRVADGAAGDIVKDEKVIAAYLGS